MLQSHHPSRPFQLSNLPSLLPHSKLQKDASNDTEPLDGFSRNLPMDSQGNRIAHVSTAGPPASRLPRTPLKGSTVDIDAAVEPAPAASRSQKDLSPRRIVLTKPERIAPALEIIQSSPIDTFSPVASSTPAKPPPGKVAEESPLLGKRRYVEENADINSTKPKSKGKGKAVDLALEHTSPIESPRFNASAPGRTRKRPRESDRIPSPPPKRKNLRTGVLPTSPINSAVFPPNTAPPPALDRQGSVTVSSGQFHKKPRDDRIITIKSKISPPAEVSVANTSVIESFQTSPHKPTTTAEQASSAENEKKYRVSVQATVAETSFLTSPGTSPEKQPTFLSRPPLPPKGAQRAQVKDSIADSVRANLPAPGHSREYTVPNSNGAAETLNPPPPGQIAKTIGITKLRPAATTVLPPGAGPSKNTSGTMPLRSKSTLGQVQKKNPIMPAKKGKEKPIRMTPVEYAEMLIEKYNNPNRRIPNVSQHLRGRKIFYAGVDMRYAGDATKKKMEYVRKSNART